MTQAADDTATEGSAPEQEETTQVEQPTGETPEDGKGSEATEGEGAGDEVVVSIGEESPPSEEEEQRAPEWVRELRKSNREKDRRIRELEAKVATSQPAQPVAVVVGEKPTLEACDYDAVKFERELEAWHTRKREADNQEAQRAEKQRKEQEAWQAKLEGYGKAKAALKVKDFEDAEAAATEVFSVVQQGVILNGADNAAVLVYALGKNPAKAKELAAITDPVKFAFAVAKLETQLKVTPRKSAPLPERTVRSSVAGAAAVDNTLEKLRAEAEKTGDLSKVLAFKRAQAGRGK